MRIRDAGPEDGAACAAVYEPYVRDTAITFETVPPTAEEMGGRIAAAQERHAWLVAEDADGVAGYAYAVPMKGRAAYDWSAEVSVYLRMGLRRSGLGRGLYQALFDRLVERGFLVAVAGMTLPNQASEGLHAAMGFELVGVYRGIGFKHGVWHDVAWTQRELVTPRPAEPAPLR